MRSCRFCVKNERSFWFRVFEDITMDSMEQFWQETVRNKQSGIQDCLFLVVCLYGSLLNTFVEMTNLHQLKVDRSWSHGGKRKKQGENKAVEGGRIIKRNWWRETLRDGEKDGCKRSVKETVRFRFAPLPVSRLLVFHALLQRGGTY